MQDFGITGDSLIGTNGTKCEHNTPDACSRLISSRKISMLGTSKITTYSFKLVRTGPTGITTMALPIDFEGARAAHIPAAVVAKWAEITKRAVGEASVVVYDAVPGRGERESRRQRDIVVHFKSHSVRTEVRGMRAGGGKIPASGVQGRTRAHTQECNRIYNPFQGSSARLSAGDGDVMELT
ncbi:hypothetical protein C8R44DRAFT_732966 [Mycena epipterygia]|nr:hypothetical protein C8R44DRAFT_732966 [Mycena epipterygia]